MRRNTKHLVFSVCVAFVLCAFASVASARTIYVPDDYAKIQWAVNNASAGDTIIVRDGIYYESITVSKQLTIKSENGTANCIVNGTGSDVFTLKADGIRIEGFTITGGENGIYILSNNNTIINNNIRSNNEDGIELWSNSNIISNNNISSNFDGIELYDSDNNSISTNIIRSNKWDGIFLWHSNNNIISNNNISSNNDDGIFLYFSDNNSISENIIRSNKWEGICLSVSNNNSISNNIIGSNNDDGICLGYSNNNSISNNKIRSNNEDGIFLLNSNNNSISNNNISSNNFDGIGLWNSNNNIISNNIIGSNNGGIHLSHSNETTIRKNEFINNGLFVEYSYDNIVEYNTGNGKPLVYLEDESDKIIDNAGQIILVRCKNITVMNAELTNTDVGIELFESDNCLISNSIISSNNEDGIFLLNSNNNSISENKISSNNDDGICLSYSNNNSISNNKIRSNYFGIDLSYSNNNSISENNISSNDNGIVIWFSNNNIIYMNNFINNTCNAFSNGSNIWNSTETITYTYKGKTFTNYLGNYWDDYTGSDANGDGIGETPYSIDSDRDNYPLIERFEHYFMPTPAKIFDTGRPENPYPSISGEFVGTIKTNKKIIATKLHTYPCEGTGGHTEYALICNDSFCAEAKWEGYKGDWMNISFNRTVVLMPYETYNITIVTGSYPQIHHTHSLKTENGWINCTEFIDANGKKYENWIPAIKLWS